MIPLSILDLAPIVEGATAADALRNSLDLARHAERLGYTRYWVAEHHNMRGIASAATSVVIGHLAGGTSKIRVGAGGIMLPNHSPLVIAEQFGTLEALYPGRIDLGLGRAPGTDQLTVRALRRDYSSAEEFPQDVLELQALLGPIEEGQRIVAVPGADSRVPLWILGSSLYGAQLAAMLGLPYAFASHFAPAALDQALALYRREFRPSERLARPYAIAAINVIAAPTDEEAVLLGSSMDQSFVALRTGTPGKLKPPVAGYRQTLPPPALAMLESFREASAIGSPETVRTRVAAFIERTGAEELIFAGSTYAPAARIRSLELAMAAVEGL